MIQAPVVGIHVSTATQQLNIDGRDVVLTIASPSAGIGFDGRQVVKEYVETPEYEGATSVTPSASAQILPTNGYRLTADITVDPIPSNYGLITWNGSTLTVS